MGTDPVGTDPGFLAGGQTLWVCPLMYGVRPPQDSYGAACLSRGRKYKTSSVHAPAAAKA